MSEERNETWRLESALLTPQSEGNFPANDEVTKLSELTLSGCGSDFHENNQSTSQDKVNNPDREVTSSNTHSACDPRASVLSQRAPNQKPYEGARSTNSKGSQDTYARGYPFPKRSENYRKPHSDEEPLDYKPPEHVLTELRKDYIYPLKKKSLRFSKAKYLCRLCEYHCDTVVICRKHMRDSRHVNLKEMKAYEDNLRQLPSPSNIQLEAIDELLERVASEQKLEEDGYERRTEIVAELQDKLAAYVPDATLAISGSTLSGYALKSSNLDIDIIVPPDVKPATALLAVQKIVLTDDVYTDVINDLSSRFPCMLFLHKATRVSIVVGTSAAQARSTNQLLREYRSLDPRVIKLVTCLKYWAKLCHIDDQKLGTLPAQAFPIIGVHFLQQTSPPILPCLHDLHPSDQPEKYLKSDQLDPPWKSTNSESIGRLWVQLLHYYCIDIKSQFITNIRTKKPFLRKEKTWNKRLTIEDPFYPKRNLAHTLSSSLVMDYILDIFKLTYRYFIIPQMSFGYLFKFVDVKNHVQGRSSNSTNDKETVITKSRDNLNGSVSEDELDDDQEEDDDDVELDDRLSDDLLVVETPKKNFRKDSTSNDLPESPIKELITSPSKESENITTDCNCEDEKRPIALHTIVYTLENPSICLAKKLIIQVEKRHLFYIFKEDCFTGGLKVPLFCSACQKNGHTKNNCTEYNLPPLSPFPEIRASFYRLLTQMLITLKQECEPTYDEIMERDRLVSELQAFIRQSYSGAVLKLFGSSTNGFGFANSDLDICLSFKGNATGEGLNFIHIIESLSERLKRFRKCGYVLAITTAKVPIVKCTIKSYILDPQSNMRRHFMLEADLSLYNTLALQNTQLLNMYASIDRRVQILGYGMKYFAKLCSIGDASRGSLSSYAYIIIVIHYLQQCKPPVIPVLQELNSNGEQPKLLIDGWNAWFFDSLKALPNIWKSYGRNKQSIGELWIGMLRYYTETFDWSSNVITIRQYAPLTRLEKLWTTKCIAIEDPFDLNHNLGAGLTRKMNTFIMKSFIKGRTVFGYAEEVDHHPYEEFMTYFFDPKRLTDGAPPNDRGCRWCGKIGHIVKDCPRKKQANDRKDDRRKRTQTKEEQKAQVIHEEIHAGKFGRGPEARDKLLETLPKGTIVLNLPSEQIFMLKMFYESPISRNQLISLGYRIYPYLLFNSSKVSEKSVVFKVPCLPDQEAIFFVSRMWLEEDATEKQRYLSHLDDILLYLSRFLNIDGAPASSHTANSKSAKHSTGEKKKSINLADTQAHYLLDQYCVPVPPPPGVKEKGRKKAKAKQSATKINPSVDVGWIRGALGIKIEKKKKTRTRKAPADTSFKTKTGNEAAKNSPPVLVSPAPNDPSHLFNKPKKKEESTDAINESQVDPSTS